MNDYVVVYTAYGKLDAETVRLFLEANGFDVLLNQESYGSTLGLTIGPMGEVQVLVPVSQAERAAAILNEMEEGKFEDADWDESQIDETQVDDKDDFKPQND